MKDNKNNNFESIVPEIVKGTDNLHVADILYNNICSVVPFPKLLRYSGRLIQNNSNDITPPTTLPIINVEENVDLPAVVSSNENNEPILSEMRGKTL